MDTLPTPEKTSLKKSSLIRVKKNIGKEFFKLICTHFTKNHSFRKMFNLNTIKISYSLMKSMKNLVKQHNARVLKNQENLEKISCNCRVRDNCPLYTNVLCIKLMSLPKMNVKNILGQLKKNLNCATIITPCHLDTRSV